MPLCLHCVCCPCYTAAASRSLFFKLASVPGWLASPGCICFGPLLWFSPVVCSSLSFVWLSLYGYVSCFLILHFVVGAYVLGLHLVWACVLHSDTPCLLSSSCSLHVHLHFGSLQLQSVHLNFLPMSLWFFFCQFQYLCDAFWACLEFCLCILLSDSAFAIWASVLHWSMHYIPQPFLILEAAFNFFAWAVLSETGFTSLILSIAIWS